MVSVHFVALSGFVPSPFSLSFVPSLWFVLTLEPKTFILCSPDACLERGDEKPRMK